MHQVKKILFLTDNFPPEVNAPATRTYEHACEWVAKGLDVTIITCVPNFPHGKVYSGYKNKLFSKENINGINVIRVWTYISPNEGFIKRVFDYISFGVMAFIVGLFIKTDLIIATTPQFFTAISGRLLSAFKTTPWIMEVRDLWPESIVAVGALKSGKIVNLLEKIELSLYSSAYKIIVVTDSFKVKISSRGINPNKIYIHKNGVILDQFSPRKKDVQLLLANPQLTGKRIFSYIGTHGLAHGLSFIVDILPRLQIELPGVHFLFIGDGAEKENLIKQANFLKVKNLTFISSVSKDEVVRYLSLIDVAVVNLKKSDTFKDVIPSKIFEAAALRKPILLGLDGESKYLINSYQSGLCYDPENENDFVKKCSEILDNDNYQKFQNGCTELAKSFDRKQIALDILKTITDN